MKRRAFLTSIGAGSVGAGALVGTGGYSRIRSQRRVKLEVKEDDILIIDRGPGISWISVCCGEGDDHPGPLKEYIECITLSADGEEVDVVGLTGIGDICDVYSHAGGLVEQHQNGDYEPPAEITPSDFCGQPEPGDSDDQEFGTKIEGGELIDLKIEAELPDCL